MNRVVYMIHLELLWVRNVLCFVSYNKSINRLPKIAYPTVMLKNVCEPYQKQECLPKHKLDPKYLHTLA